MEITKEELQNIIAKSVNDVLKPLEAKENNGNNTAQHANQNTEKESENTEISDAVKQWIESKNTENVLSGKQL